MKNNLVKYYIATLYLCSTFVMFAQPGTDTDTAGGAAPIDGSDAPGAPIDDYILLLAIVGIILVFMRFRAIKAKQIQRQKRMY